MSTRHMPHKDVPVRGHMYRLNRLEPSDGVWLVSIFTNALRNARAKGMTTLGDPVSTQQLGDSEPEADPSDEKQMKLREEGMLMTAAFIISSLDRRLTKEVMEMCLQKVDRLEHPDGSPVAHAMPIMSGAAHAYEDLANNGPALLELTKQAIAFDIVPFLVAEE